MGASPDLWVELQPLSASAPRRLLVFLHDRRSSPERFAPVGVAWHMKFPGATGALMTGIEPRADGRFDWFDARGTATERAPRIDRAVDELRRRIAALQREHSIDASRTMLIGFGQGATMALEALRHGAPPARLVVGYASRLARPVRRDETIDADIHLVHGTHDTLVPLVHARQAHRGLAAAGARCTLDIVSDGVHSIDQDMLILGTTRAMQSVFRGRRRAHEPGRGTRLH